MVWNKNSGYGQVIGQLPFIGSGKVFVVGDSGTANRSMLQDLFNVDPDGVDRFFSTIDAAIGACTADAGDVILVMPGHTESISAAAGIAADVAGISIIGLGQGSDRPTLTFETSTAADIDIDAANITVENILFKCDKDGLVAGIDVNAANFTLKNCEFQNVGTDDALIWIITDANADDIHIIGNVFRQNHAGPTEAIRLVGADRAIIKDNYIFGDYSTAAINGITTASIEILIKENTIVNNNAAGFAIDLVASSTGRIEDNRGTSGYATDLSKMIDPASCQMSENYFSNTAGETGALVGTASA